MSLSADSKLLVSGMRCVVSLLVGIWGLNTQTERHTMVVIQDASSSVIPLIPNTFPLLL